MKYNRLFAKFNAQIAIYGLIFIFFTPKTHAQNTNDGLRLYDNNTIAWYQTTANVKLTDKWGLVGEYAWRRTNFTENWLQGLIRMGINYELVKNIQARVGYCFVETYPYGDYPVLPEGYTNIEHRAYQQIEFKNANDDVTLASRFRLEQRWQNKHKGSEAIDYWKYSNRVRFQMRADVPLKFAKPFYLAAFDEIFVGFGPSVGVNIFDQNRAGLLLGYKFNEKLKIEGGYLNHILQQGATVNNKSVIQLNEGLLINLILNFDLSPTVKDLTSSPQK